MSSNARKPGAGNYRSGYLRSVTWFRRRDAWFAEQLSRTGVLRCTVCWRIAARRDLQLHHVDYSGVSRAWRGWHAGEEHEQLLAMHPVCHDLLHRIIDTDLVLRRHRTRPIATVQAIRIARASLAARERAGL